MPGLNDTDILVNRDWQLSPLTNGAPATVSGASCFIQDIELEAITQEGELFYDTTYGWSLLDFLQSNDNELIRVEIKQRIHNKLSKRSDIIDTTGIVVDIGFQDEAISLEVGFNILGSDAQIVISIDRVNAEVVIV